MTVYVVKSSYYYQSEDVLGAFSTVGLAKAAFPGPWETCSRNRWGLVATCKIEGQYPFAGYELIEMELDRRVGE